MFVASWAKHLLFSELTRARCALPCAVWHCSRSPGCHSDNIAQVTQLSTTPKEGLSAAQPDMQGLPATHGQHAHSATALANRPQHGQPAQHLPSRQQHQHQHPQHISFSCDHGSDTAAAQYPPDALKVLAAALASLSSSPSCHSGSHHSMQMPRPNMSHIHQHAQSGAKLSKAMPGQTPSGNGAHCHSCHGVPHSNGWRAHQSCTASSSSDRGSMHIQSHRPAVTLEQALPAGLRPTW